MNVRSEFPMLEEGIIYFDNGATTFKPYSVIEAINKYYYSYTANAHRGDYDISLKVDDEYESARLLVKEFINAATVKEIVFTSGTTEALNMIVFGFFMNNLSKGDEVLLTKAEHASNLLPWFELKRKLGIVLKFIDLDEFNEVTIENVQKSITKNTKVISLAQVTNVIGDIRPIKEICKLAHNNGIKVVVDAAQSVPHMSVDVIDLDCDFMAFSGHKMLAPTGIGVLYGKLDLLNELDPVYLGGGMNTSFSSDGYYEVKNLPTKLEAGTPNIEGALGLKAAIEFINSIGINNISKYVLELKEYLVLKLEELDNVVVYNKFSKSGIVTFNIKNVFSQDTSIYLNQNGICVRAGNHCAKIIKDVLNVTNTCRISLYFYNTKEEIDVLVDVLRENRVYDNII